MKVAFIGLGIMGSRMAKNLEANGIDLTVYNRSKEIYQHYTCDQAQTAVEAVKSCDLVFSMLSTPEVVCELAFNENGFVRAMKKESLWIDCSTVNPSFTRECYTNAKQSGVHFVDVPVAGSKLAAERGELVFFVGGEADSMLLAKPCLDAMGKKSIFLGHIAAGTSLKTLVNYSLAQSMVAYGEVLALGKKMNLSSDLLYDLLPELPVFAPYLKLKKVNLKAENFETEFPLEWMAKDVKLTMQTANELSVDLPLSSQVLELYNKSIKQGLSRQDFSAVTKVL